MFIVQCDFKLQLHSAFSFMSSVSLFFSCSLTASVLQHVAGDFYFRHFSAAKIMRLLFLLSFAVFELTSAGFLRMLINKPFAPGDDP